MKMRTTLLRPAVTVLSLLVPMFTGTLTSSAQQRNDPQFDTKVARPAHTKKQPRVLIDGAHINAFSVVTQRIDPLVQLMRSDGLTVDTSKEPFSTRTLSAYELLVVLTARGKDKAMDPAFSAEEIEAAYRWVDKGGSMLFCVDHTPFVEAGGKLAERFGVTVFPGTLSDSVSADRWLGDKDFRTPLYSNANKITRGRDQSERLNKVGVFGGVSLTGPKKSWNLFTISKTAVNDENGRPGEALGTSQAVALKVGKGRLVITADCSMWTAQLVTVDKKEHQYGMARTDLDNRQFALNVVRWLTGALK